MPILGTKTLSTLGRCLSSTVRHHWSRPPQSVYHMSSPHSDVQPRSGKQGPSLFRLVLKRRPWCWRQSGWTQPGARPQSNDRSDPGRSCRRRPTYRPPPRYLPSATVSPVSLFFFVNGRPAQTHLQAERRKRLANALTSHWDRARRPTAHAERWSWAQAKKHRKRRCWPYLVKHSSSFPSKDDVGRILVGRDVTVPKRPRNIADTRNRSGVQIGDQIRITLWPLLFSSWCMTRSEVTEPVQRDTWSLTAFFARRRPARSSDSGQKWPLEPGRAC